MGEAIHLTTADAVRAHVLAETPTALTDPTRRSTLADAIEGALRTQPDATATATSVDLALALLGDGRTALVAGVVDRWLGATRWDEVLALRARAEGVVAPGASAAAGIALARGIAFVDAEAAGRDLSRLAAVARDAAESEAVSEARALLAAVRDVPPGEVAAKRALARVAAERAWNPEAWGRDHGALVALARRRSTRDSSGFGGPLMRYLGRCAPDEMKRIAKKAGAASSAGSAGEWYTRGAPPDARPLGMFDPRPQHPEQRPSLQATIAAEAAKRERARREGGREREEDRDPDGVTGRGRARGLSELSSWWPVLVILIVLIRVLLPRLFR